MLIEECILENYRQFKGRHKVRFSTDPKKNITLIAGANGSGKTNLLRAICWCLFGEEPLRGQKVEDELPISLKKGNHRSTPDGSETVRVALTVSKANGQKLRLIRAGTFKITRTGQTRIDITGIQHLNGIRSGKPRSISSTWPVDQESLWQLVERFNMVDDEPILQDRYPLLQMVLFFDPCFREKIECTVSECGKIFRSIIGKDDYCFSSVVRMDAEHELRLVRPDGSYIAPGAGQSEALRLAFSLAVRKVSKSRMPIILDSPFLRTRKYASNILKVLASVQTQVIVMALDTEVSQVPELDELVGKRYFIKHDSRTGTSAIE